MRIWDWWRSVPPMRLGTTGVELKFRIFVFKKIQIISVFFFNLNNNITKIFLESTVPDHDKGNKTTGKRKFN